ncbi:MAG: alcohol dehydrogenase catalytic domain-containing protein [Spirochaetales bacterium]|nr:alcohol dehydrogenase catalytic domain-containing protein [Spirochaetales bacterium]
MLQVKMPEAYKIENLDIPVPEIKDHEVLIKMKTIGICGSDIQIYHGLHKYMSFPVVQGHEGAGIIEKTGAAVTQFKAGDKVTIQPQIFCGECQPCLSGNENVCENIAVYGVHTDGMAQDYIAMPESVVVKLSDSMDYETGAFVEPVSVAVGAIRRCGDVMGQNIVVLGAGPIGNLVAQVADADGAEVLITDINDKKLKLAEECGIPHTRNTKDTDLRTAIADQFGKRGADIIIDCAAVTPSILSAINAARPASKIVVVGNFKKPVEIELPMIQRQSIDIIGVMMYVRRDYEKAIRLMSEGRVVVDKMVTTSYPVTDFEKAYRFIDENPLDVMKILMKFND